MEFDISVSQLNKLMARLDKDSVFVQHFSGHGLINGRLVVQCRWMDEKVCDELYKIALEENDRPIQYQMIGYKNVLADKEKQSTTLVVPYLDLLPEALINYFKQDAIDGWVYRKNKDGVLLPWLILDVEYIEPNEGRPYVSVQLLANTVQAANRATKDLESAEDWRIGMTNSIMFYQREMGGLTIPELLGNKGFFKECREFKEEYEKHAQYFQRYQSYFGRQFIARNFAFMVNDNLVRGNLELFRIKQNLSAKCVNDEELLERHFETRWKADFWRENGVTDKFNRIPLHCYLYMFHLELHQNIWVHVQNLEEYQYKPELREKLILPEAHRLLIDTLTTNMDVLIEEDIVEGKSGGTTILCMGGAGLGKTLTAEVYSEIVGKPLYRVHSGQLGTSAESVEAALTEILRRAARWDAILLLDEADVYIRRRDNDLQHNAIVAEFLRTLEYFDGLLFMTTNRVDDVDDAILSRCIAVIRYDTPQHDDATRLWKTLSKQFKVDISDELIEQLIQAYPCCSGRDIKELLKLTSRFCMNIKQPLSLKAFQQCATFRGKH